MSDFAGGVIHVRQQLARGRRGVPPHRIPPKTRASVREIRLLPQLAAVLRQHKHKNSARRGELPVSPRLTFAEAAARWLADFEAKVIAGARRDRTLDLYRSQLHCHLLPRLGRRRLALITRRMDLGLTQEQLAERMGTSHSAIEAQRSIAVWAGGESPSTLDFNKLVSMFSIWVQP